MSRSRQTSGSRLTKWNTGHYCYRQGMRRRQIFSSVVVAMVLLPGLALGAPVAGPCGRCGGNGTCCLEQPVEPPGSPHGCCAAERSETVPETSLGGSTCECGRDVAAATLGDAQPLIDGSALDAPAPLAAAVSLPTTVMGRGCNRPPAPPPSPPVFLVDCAFLT